MALVASINKRILQEIDSQTEDAVVKELARAFLQFEMENWKMEKIRFREYFEKKIELGCRKRLSSK